MFSGNHKISPRQLYRNYAIGLISLSALLPPLVMNRESITSIGIALVFLGIYLAAGAVIPRPGSALVKSVCYAHYWLLDYGSPYDGTSGSGISPDRYSYLGSSGLVLFV